MSDKTIDRATLRDWIQSDGLEHLFEEGYLNDESIDHHDYALAGLVTVAFEHWRQYSRVARVIEELVGV
jgi:hypothetical protein